MNFMLDNDNFLNWQHQVLMILKSLGLLKHLNSSVTKPAIDTEECEIWNKSDAYVSSFLTTNLSASLVHLARAINSASELWSRIEESFYSQVWHGSCDSSGCNGNCGGGQRWSYVGQHGGHSYSAQLVEYGSRGFLDLLSNVVDLKCLLDRVIHLMDWVMTLVLVLHKRVRIHLAY
ncbi:hypothetical protein HanIR_Chr14g0689121 [Helianthus annuus]|nr:hypothetical protein HanIR_Chr14g0689121 [Helianthus annuus]